MVKKAVLVGCNYPGSDAELAGCVNDVGMVKEFLIESKGFDEGDIQVLIDTDSSVPSPTGENVKNTLNAVVGTLEPGDVFVFHFSGHGTQVPSHSDDPEPDRKDEAICPTDMNLIVDDDLKQIFSQLSPEVQFTFISDCCHSGSMLDHGEVQIEGAKAGGTGEKLPEPASLTALLGGGDREIDPSEIGVKSRELPPDAVAGQISRTLGVPVSPDMIRRLLPLLFGSSASMAGGSGGADMLSSLTAQFMGGGGGGGIPGMSSGLGGLGSALGGLSGGAPPEEATSGGLGGLGAALGGITGGGEAEGATSGGLGGLSSLLQTAGVDKIPPAGPAPQLDPMHPDVGILITGCQADETSADVRPPDGGAFGALTHTLMETVKENPTANYIDVVTTVRAKMAEGGYAQNPCLECSDANSAKPFICDS